MPLFRIAMERHGARQGQRPAPDQVDPHAWVCDIGENGDCPVAPGSDRRLEPAPSHRARGPADRDLPRAPRPLAAGLPHRLRLLSGGAHEHPPYGSFCPAPGHQLGFNELKAAEVAILLEGIATSAPPEPGFRTAWRIARVVDAILLSAAERLWVRPTEV